MRVFCRAHDSTNHNVSSTLVARKCSSLTYVSVSCRVCGASGRLSVFGGDDACDSCRSGPCHCLSN